MGRQKAIPIKQKNSEENWCTGPINYIPVKKRKSKRISLQQTPHNIVLATETHKKYYLGKIIVGTTSNVVPKDYTECKITFLPQQEENEHVLLDFGSCQVVVNSLIHNKLIKNILTWNLFTFGIDSSQENVFLEIHLKELPLPKFHKKLGVTIQDVFSLIFNTSITDSNAEDSEETNDLGSQQIDQFYENIKRLVHSNLKLGSDIVQHPKLNAMLKPYQVNAVRWMLIKEKQYLDQEDILHPLYTKLTLKSGIEIYYNKYTGFIDPNEPLTVKSCKGGILADEMGLGKTVEVLACILLNPKTSDFNECNKDNDNSNDVPIVEKIERKRKSQTCDNVTEDVGHSAKKIKAPKEWVKPSSSKSQVRVALEKWYNETLTSVSARPSGSKIETSVQCVCGNESEESTVQCYKCGKIQHDYCVAYTQEFGEYMCPQCWMNEPILESAATLIVCPISLRTQWTKEILKHVKGNLKVLDYEGYQATPVYPLKLLMYDVVITTYSVLKSELRLTEIESEKLFRNRRKYSPPGCPLTRMKWWRLCMDEAQTVESHTAMAAEMTRKISAHIRWAVTGTPITKDISDLYGLVDFIQMEPFNDKFIWKHKFLTPYLNGNPEPMFILFSQIFWRTCKHDVIDQINIPKQITKVHWLEFSAIERFFYNCEHKSSSDAFLTKARTFNENATLQTLDRSYLKNVLAPLLSLRQVCTYANNVRTRYLTNKKPVNSMKELLDALIAQNTGESEDFLRVVTSCLNGLAGIYLLLNNSEMAIAEYREVLQLYTRFNEEEKEANVTVDNLQIIHTMYNLAEILEICPTELKTLRDDDLRKNCEEVEQKYIKKFINESMTALQECLLITNQVKELENKFVFEIGTWYSDLIDWININNYNNDFYTKIESSLISSNVKSPIDTQSHRSILYSIATWDQDVANLRKTCIEKINTLYKHCPDDELKIIIPATLLTKATNCHLRPDKKTKAKTKCPFCIVNDKLKSYELKIFYMTERKAMYEEMSLMGSWKPTPEELILKSVLSIAKQKNADIDLIEDGEIHISMLETIKKEFKEIRKFWTFLHQQVSAQDEIDICKIRMRLNEAQDDNIGNSGERKMKSLLKNLTYDADNRLETVHVLSEHELEFQKALLHSQKHYNLSSLEKNLGVRKYLETLHKQTYEGQSPDPCPICKNALEQHWAIIPCGHSYCLECIQILLQHSHGVRFQCSVCRVQHLVKDVSYIKSGMQDTDSNGPQLKGNYSTKVEAVIKLVLKLKAEEGDVKILMYSTWIPVLTHLKTALINNNISAELVNSPSMLEKQIEHFKDIKGSVSVLLLPIRLGSKGLNLVEATHVILIEPLLNTGDELQAVGRVHRIGQTKQTVVHKFLIKDTIEESIHNSTNANSKTWEKNKVTLKQLINLFVTDETPITGAENLNSVEMD